MCSNQRGPRLLSVGVLNSIIYIISKTFIMSSECTVFSSFRNFYSLRVLLVNNNTLTGLRGHRLCLAYFFALPAPTLSRLDTPLPDLFEPFRKVRLRAFDAPFRRFRRVEGGGRNCFMGLLIIILSQAFGNLFCLRRS